jgi:RNA polymerase sigma factor (sigma-70 family)
LDALLQKKFKMIFIRALEVGLNTAGGILQSTRGQSDAPCPPSQTRFFLCAFPFRGCYNLKTMTPDAELLARFARTNSEDAFAELVKRHVNLVYSAALRQVNGDAHLAQDAAQTVFADLARKAGPLSRRESLTGWLYTGAHFAAAKIVRGENRRRDREEKFMREPVHETAPEAGWEQLRPTLDDAMHELGETDREAILLRYFENRPFAEVGAKLGLNENAARMRVERALEKLRAAFAQRGVAATATLAAVISANAVQLAPAGLAATLTTASVVSAGTGTFTLFKIMTVTQLKLGISALFVAGAATALVVQHQAQEKLRADNTALTQQLAQLQTDNTSLSNRLAAAGDAQSFPDDKLNELLKLRGQVGALRQQASELEQARKATSAANQRVHEVEQDLAATLSSKAQFTAHEDATVNAAKQLGLAMRIYQNDHDQEYPTSFLQLTNELGGSFTIGGIDVYAFEFVNVGALRVDYPGMIELRERLARQAPDGTWRRIYGLADGSVQTAASSDGNFDAWEKQNSQSPPPSQ